MAIFGLILSALAGLWYWQIMRVAAIAIAAGGADSINRVAWLAIALFFLGLAISVIGAVINFFSAEEPGTSAGAHGGV